MRPIIALTVVNCVIGQQIIRDEPRVVVAEKFVSDMSNEMGKTMQITILKCGDCGKLTAPPRQLCPACHSAKIAAHMVDGAGKLLSWTVVRRPPMAFRDDGVYTVGVVALASGVPVAVRMHLPEGGREPKSGDAVRMTGEHKGAAVFELA